MTQWDPDIHLSLMQQRNWDGFSHRKNPQKFTILLSSDWRSHFSPVKMNNFCKIKQLISFALCRAKCKSPVQADVGAIPSAEVAESITSIRKVNRSLMCSLEQRARSPALTGPLKITSTVTLGHAQNLSLSVCWKPNLIRPWSCVTEHHIWRVKRTRGRGITSPHPKPCHRPWPNPLNSWATEYFFQSSQSTIIIFLLL